MSSSYRKLATATRAGKRLDELKTLADTLAKSIDAASKDPEQLRQLAPLAKQYRETIAEIEDIERGEIGDDAIGEVLKSRAANGASGAVRPRRA